MSADYRTVWLPGLVYALVAIASALAWAVGTAADATRAADPSQPACEPFGSALTAPAGQWDGTSATLFTHGTVSLRTCRAGVLTVRMRGVEVGGVGSHAVVSVGTDVAFDGEVIASTVVVVDVDPDAWIAVSFVNDGVVNGEDRNLWIDEISFAARR